MDKLELMFGNIEKHRPDLSELDKIKKYILSSSSFNVYELENVEQRIKKANFCYIELVQLEGLIRRRMDENMRNVGYSGGFNDLLAFVTQLRQAA